METETKHVIWQNYEINEEDWFDDYIEQHPDVYETDISVLEYATQCNEEYLEDERTNLDIKLDHPIVIFADIGLWFGRRRGYRVIGSNISDCLNFEKDCDYAEWYVEDGDLKSRQTHHDGTNLLVYRELLVDEDEFDELLYDDKFDPEKHCRKIGNKVSEVYGW